MPAMFGQSCSCRSLQLAIHKKKILKIIFCGTSTATKSKHMGSVHSKKSQSKQMQKEGAAQTLRKFIAMTFLCLRLNAAADEQVK